MVSAVAAVAALVIPLALFMVQQRESKALTLETISSASVADLTDPALSVLKLTYNGDPVTRVTTATIEVSNSGTQPIQVADFERPLLIRFEAPSAVLAVTLTEREPGNLAPTLSLSSSTITVVPLLLNPGDRFRVNVVLRGDFKEPLADARIAGIRDVSRGTLSGSNPTRRGVAFLVVGSIATLGYGYLAMFANPFRRRPIALLPRIDVVGTVLILGMAGAGLMFDGARVLGASNRVLLWAMIPGTLLLLGAMTLGAARTIRVDRAFRVIGNPEGQAPPNPALEPTART